MNYSLLSSIELNRQDLERRIPSHLLRSLMDQLGQSSFDHESLRDFLINFKEFLGEYLTERLPQSGVLINNQNTSKVL